jgi:hypothetical protein
MRSFIFALLISNSLFAALDSGMAQGTVDPALSSFVQKFREQYKGEYILNPSQTCQPIRKATKVKVDMIQNGNEVKIRVIYIDDRDKQVGSKLYPIENSRLGVVNSKGKDPNSMLWETNVTDRSFEAPRTGTEYERMTFNEHVLSFDVLKKRDPVGFFGFLSQPKLSEKRAVISPGPNS